MPEFLHIVWSAFLIIAFFGGSIFVHELGHYLAARRRGLKVERFSIGFGPKLFGFTRDGVEWIVSAFPLGGYVALPQLANLEGLEGEYKDKYKDLPPISYLDTLIVAVMGVVFNMIFAFVLALILWGVGVPSTDSLQTTTVGSVVEEITDLKGQKVAGPAFAAGIKSGDIIEAIDGAAVHNWQDVKQSIVIGSQQDGKGARQCTLTLKREGKSLTVITKPILSGAEKLRSLGIIPAEELFVGSIYKNSPAERAGLAKGDQLLSINGATIYNFATYQSELTKLSAAPFNLSVAREGKTVTLNLKAQQVAINKKGDKEPLIGVELEPKIITLYQDPFTQIGAAANLTFRTLGTLFNPASDIKVNHLSGPPGIAWIIHRLSSDFRQVLSFIVMINVNLAVLNLLPLPVLDGGHMVIATINRLRKKPISGEYIGILQNIFTIMLLGTMLYVMFFADLPRLKRDYDQNQKDKKELSEAIKPVFSAEGK